MQNRLFTYETIIQENYLDTFGHVNNAMYLYLFEQARWDLLNKSGYGLNFIRESKLGPVILEAHIRYLKELTAREEIVITTSLISYEGKIGKLEQSMLKNNEVACTGLFTIALFDLHARKIVPPTEEWLKAIAS